MTIEIADDAVRTFYSAAAVLLVEQHFSALIPAAIASEVTVILFTGSRIGGAGPAAPLETIGLPVAPLFVVEQSGSAMAAGLLDFARRAKAPQPIAVCRLPRPGGIFGGAGPRRLERFLEQSALAALRQVAALANQREHELQAMRQVVADQNGRLGRLRDGLALAGFANEEFSLPLGARPIVERGGRATIIAPLHGVESIRVRTTSADTGRVRVVFTLNGREIETSTLEFGGASPTLEIVVPTELAALRDGVEISFQALRADGHPIGPGVFGSVLFRLKSDGAPASVSSPGIRQLGDAAPQSGPSPFVAQGVLLDAGSTVRIAGKLQQSGRPPQVSLAISPHGETGARPAILATDDSAGSDILLEGRIPSSGRYDIATVTEPTSPAGHIVWSQPSVTLSAATAPVAFASARFASLANAVSFCDGPADELAINNAQGFATIAVADGTSYLQTHPLVGRVAGARLPRLIPYGTTSVWIDAENANASAKPFEFLAVIAREVQTGPVDRWITGLRLPGYNGYSIIERDDEIVARTVLGGGRSYVFRMDLTRPLAYDGTLYCLVRPTTANTDYGWCRWHRIVVGLPATERLAG